MRRIGLLGGTFDPIHVGHTLLAQQVCRALELESVLLMVAGDPPHKLTGTDARTRFDMTALAASAHRELIACDLELKRSGKSYTVETLARLQEQYPDTQVVTIVGSDMLMDLPNWYQVERLFELTTFACVVRVGVPLDELTVKKLINRGAQVQLLPIEIPDISSTKIRNRVTQAKPVSDMLLPVVEQYIYEQGLYLPFSVKVMQEKCKMVLNNNRYRHTMGVVHSAIALADRYGVDGEQARLAALLHDCARGMGLDQMRSAVQSAGIAVDEQRLQSTSLLHAVAGAVCAQRDYGVTDPAVLTAIRRHTTGAYNMTKLDKILYLADMIEPNRTYPGVEALRAISMQGLDDALYAAMLHELNYVRAQGETVHPDSILAMRALKPAGKPV